MRLTKTVYSQEELEKCLVECVVCEDQPFTFVDAPEIRLLLGLLKPGIKIPSATTIKDRVMETYKVMKARLGDQLCNAGSKISLTLDCWTSPHHRAYLGITAHYIDANWVPHSLVLAFVRLSGEHTAENLCEAFIPACDEFGILGHVLGITTDNAANINSFLSRLEEKCRIRDIVFDKEEQ